MRRRSFVLLGTSAAVPGCLRSRDPEITLGGVRVENHTPREVTLDVRVEKDGEAVHESTVMAPPRRDAPGTRLVECTWPPEAAGTFVVAARRSLDGEWAEVTSDGIDDGSCRWASVEVGESVVSSSWRSCEPYDETPCELRS